MRKLSRAVLVFIVILHSMALLTGCTDKQPARVAWVSIEKPPIRLIYVNRQDLVSDETVHHLLQHIERQPFKNYKFNAGIKIKLDANAHQSDIESDSDISYTTIQRN